MTTNKNIHINYPASKKIYVRGEINNIRVGMREITLADTLSTDEQGETVRKKNNPLVVYDTSGPYSDPAIPLDLSQGLPRTREEWYAKRKGIERTATGYRAKAGKRITQMYYARKRVITPEMEYVAIRENQQVEALGLRSYITPEFVRKEIARGHAVLPANINHPESEPMIIGRNFLVKVNASLPSKPLSQEEEIRRALLCCKHGADVITDQSAGAYTESLMRTLPVPVCADPVLHALTRVEGEAEELSWALFQDTLTQAAEQGVDLFIIPAGMLRAHAELAANRLTGIISPSGRAMARWMRAHGEENFLYAHFPEICQLLASYDATLILGNGLRSGSIYDANDNALLAELTTQSRLAKEAVQHYVQVIVEGPGYLPLNKIQPYMKEQGTACAGVPHYSPCPQTTDTALSHAHIAAAIGAAHIAWQGSALIGCVMPMERLDSFRTEELREGVITAKIAAHTADLAKGHPGVQARDNAMSKAQVDRRLSDQINLSFDPERSQRYHKAAKAERAHA